MLRNLLITSFVAIALVGCSKPAVPPPAAESSTPAAAAPAAVNPALSPELAARLIRPHSPVIGPAQAPVTIVEFLDPACEACRAFETVVKQIQFLHPNEVRVVVRYAAFHEGSDEAVRILEAARRQGKLETVLTALFEGQPEWASHHRPNIQRAWQIAAASGLNMDRAQRDSRDAATDEVLRVDADDGIALKVERTPTFYVNGKLLDPFGADPLLQLVTAELANSR